MFVDGLIDCVVFYLMFIDIFDLNVVIVEVYCVLCDGGCVIVVNFVGFIIVVCYDGWSCKGNDIGVVELIGYLDEDVYWIYWVGICI